MSAKPETPPKEVGSTLTQRDFNLLLAAFESNKNEVAVDYAKFAENCGLANANSAKASWHTLKKLDKLGYDTKAAASPAKGNEGNAKTTPGQGKKRKSAADAGVDDNDTISATPSKKKRGRKTASPGKEGGGDEIDGEILVKAEASE